MPRDVESINIENNRIHEQYCKDNNLCTCGSGKSPFTFEGDCYCEDCAPLCVE